MSYIPMVYFQDEGSEGRPNELILYQHSFTKQADAFAFAHERIEDVKKKLKETSKLIFTVVVRNS